MRAPNIQLSISQELHSEKWKKRHLSVYVKRDDLIHEDISGNKWRKLIYNVEKLQLEKKDTLITFGGAFSNHLVATAAACKFYGIQAVGIVRGDELTPSSNATLQQCHALGMKLVFVSRALYQLRYDELWWKELHIKHPNSYIVPEGGANYLGIVGCQDIWNELPNDVDRVFVAQGTTATSCGLLLGAPDSCKIHAVPVLKGFDSKDEMEQLFASSLLDEETIQEAFDRLILETDYHFGGYGKYTDELLQFIKETYQTHQLKLDPIYTGKAFFAMKDCIEKYDLQNEKIVFIHTGGIQGVRGIEEKEKISLFS